MDLTPEQIKALAESIAFHASGGTGGTGHLTDFNVSTRQELVTRITDMLGDKNTEFFVNNSQRPDRAGTVVFFNKDSQSFLVFNPNQLDSAIEIDGRILPAGGPQKAVYGENIGPDNLAGTFYRQPKLDGNGDPILRTGQTAETAFGTQLENLRQGVAKDMNAYPPPGADKTYTPADVPTQKISESDDWARRIAAEDTRIRNGLPIAMDRVQSGRYLAQDLRDNVGKFISNDNVTTSGEGNKLEITTPKKGSNYDIRFSDDGKTATVTTTSRRGNVHTVALDETGTSRLIETLRSDDFMSNEKYKKGLASLDDIIRMRGTVVAPGDAVADQDSQRNPAPVDGEGDADAKPKINGEGEAPDTKPKTNVGGDDVETSRPAVGDDLDLDTRTTGDTTQPRIIPDAPDAPDLPKGTGGSDTPSLRGAGDVADAADALPTSKWKAAVDGAGGSGRGMSGLTTNIAGGAGFALSAYHLKNQLFDENSTFHRDLQNEEVDGRAITALSLDATAFVADSVVVGTSALQAARVLRAADSLADAAKLSTGLSSASKFARVAGPVGLGITVVTTGLEYSIAETNEDGKRAAQAVGAGGGALGGAAIGAGLTWWLGPGAGVGAVVGGLIGAFGGGYAGGEYLDDDFQEHFDEKALAEQQANLEKVKGIGTNLEAFIKLEDEVTAAYQQLETRFNELDTEGKSEAEILAMTADQRSALEDAARIYAEKRTELARHVDGAFLSSADEKTLSDVQEFIQKRYAFLDMKEGRLREAGDTEALTRLARDRAGLEAAHTSITRLQGINDKLGENYGKTESEISRITQESVSSVQSAVHAQNEHVENYQAYILTNQAAEAQRTFEGQLERQLERVNDSYNEGQTDNTLMHRSAILMALVESGELDAQTLSEAKQEIESLQERHESELSDLRSSQSTLRRMTGEQRGLRGDDYANDYAQHNLKTLGIVNNRLADLVHTHETTSKIAGHAMEAAESAVEIQNLTAQLHLDADAAMEALNTGTQALHADVTDERESAIYQIKSDIAEKSIEVAEHSGKILSIIGQDMRDRLDDVQANLADEKEKAVPNTDTLAALEEVSGALIQVTEAKVTEIEAYEAKIKGMLENGVAIEGENFQIISSDERQRLETILQEMENVRTQYTDEIAQTKEQLRLTKEDIGERVLEQDGVSVTLDHSGRVSSYSVEENTRTFRGDKRPMLVDHDGNIYNKTSELNLVEMDLALYSPRNTITQLGEPYQSYWRPDIVHLNSIEDEAERDQVKSQEKALVDSLKGKDMGDAISAPPNSATTPDNSQGSIDNDASTTPASHHFQLESLPGNIQPSFNDISIPGASGNESSMSVNDDPDYIEAAIAMEKILAGEQLDDFEQQRLEQILSNPDIDPAVIASLSENYGDTAQSFITDNYSNTDADVATLAMVEESRQDQAAINQGTMKI